MKQPFEARHVLSYIQNNFSQYEDLAEEWTEQGEDSRYYFTGHTEQGDLLDVKVEIFGCEWSVEERLSTDEDWVLVDIFRMEESA